MIDVNLDGTTVVVDAKGGDLRPRHESQLAYWGFDHAPDSRRFALIDADVLQLVPKLLSYFDREQIDYHLNQMLQQLITRHEEARNELNRSLEECAQLKDGRTAHTSIDDFRAYSISNLSRPLKDHQLKAAIHLIHAFNGANFSVPGSGKTAVVLAVFAYLRHLEAVDSLFVLGPPACFGPWRSEYTSVLGTPPRHAILAGGDVDERRFKYLIDRDSVRDLYLMSYQTLERDWKQVRSMFQHRGVKFYLIADEAHYIKQVGGLWANAALNIAPYAARRCVLTGTPFPRSYTDAFNLFDVLWPGVSPLTDDRRVRIQIHSDRNEHAKAAAILDSAIAPLYYRVRKDDLHLAPQIFHDPIRIRMKKNERYVYDSILDRIRHQNHSDFYRDFEILVRLRRGRMIRLRQCVSYAGLLRSSIGDLEDSAVNIDSLASLIQRYDESETPSKVDALQALVQKLRMNGEKVVVWSNFVGTLHLLERHLASAGHGVRMIFGGTPVEDRDACDELTRESIIAEFINPASSVNVLVANPAACAESISLHKTCSHAVYYDLSYNCAQYLQSLDRIHRVGGSEEKQSHYYVLQYEDSIDNDILQNVRAKSERMSAIIDQDYPIYSLDMFGDDDSDTEAYMRLFGTHE